MKSLLLTIVIATVTSLAACSKTDAPTAQSAAPTQQALDLVAANGKGFTAGSLMSANAVYVLFDPQCPHCGHLWNASQPLLGKVKFIWVPVAIINGNSAPQGAALLSAPNPSEAMSLHEASILAGTGGTPPRASMSAEMEAAIRKNTEIFSTLKLESVPFLVARNLQTGEVVSHSGAMETAALAQLLGVNSN